VTPAGGLSESLIREVRSLLWADAYLQAVKRVIQFTGLALHEAMPVVDAEWEQVRQQVQEGLVWENG
jgi:ribosomal protein L7/L12